MKLDRDYFCSGERVTFYDTLVGNTSAWLFLQYSVPKYLPANCRIAATAVHGSFHDNEAGLGSTILEQGKQPRRGAGRQQ